MNDQIAGGPKIKLLLSPLDGITEKYRYLNRTAGRIDESCPAERKQVGDACERDGDGMKVHPVHVLGNAFQNVRERLECGLRRRDVLTNRMKEESAGAAGGIQDAHCERRSDRLLKKGKSLQLPRSVAEALSGHLAESTMSKVPHLDGTAAVVGGGDDAGLWQLHSPSVERMKELDAMLATDQLPGFGRLHLL